MLKCARTPHPWKLRKLEISCISSIMDVPESLLLGSGITSEGDANSPTRTLRPTTITKNDLNQLLSDGQVHGLHGGLKE